MPAENKDIDELQGIEKLAIGYARYHDMMEVLMEHGWVEKYDNDRWLFRCSRKPGTFREAFGKFVHEYENIKRRASASQFHENHLRRELEELKEKAKRAESEKVEELRLRDGTVMHVVDEEEDTA